MTPKIGGDGVLRRRWISAFVNKAAPFGRVTRKNIQPESKMAL
jgi:hypothetical protein